MCIITDSQHQGSYTASSSYTRDEDLSGPSGRIARYIVTAFSPSGTNVVLGTASDGWEKVATFGPKTSNLQAAVLRATTAIFEAVDPPADLPLVVDASLSCVFASNLSLIDPD